MSSFHQPPPHDNGGGNGVASAFGNRFLAPMKARRNNNHDQRQHQQRDRLRRGVGTTSASTRFMNKQVSNVSSVPSLEVSNNTNKSYHVGGPHRRRERAGGGFSYHVTSHSTQHHSHNSSALQDRLMEMLVFELHENGAREFRTMTLRELYTHVMKAITTRPPSTEEEEEEESEQKRESSIHSTKTTSSTASSASKKREGSGMSVADSQSQLTKAPFPPPSNLPPPPQPPDSSKRIPRGPSMGTVTMPIPLPRPSTGVATSGSSVTPLNASLPRTLPAGTSSSMLSNPTQNRNQSQTFSPVSPSAQRGLIQPLPQQQQPQVPVFVPTSVPYRERLGGYLHPRDMRRLVTPFSNTNEPELMVRRHVMLINFDPLRAIVLRDRLLVLVPDGADAILMRIEKRLRGGLEELENDVYGDVQTTNSTATGSGVQEEDDPNKSGDADDDDDDDHNEKNNRILMMDDDDDDDHHHEDDDSEHDKNDKDDFMLDDGIYYNTSSKKKSFRSVFSETKKGSTTSSGGSAGGKKKPSSSSSSSFSMGESGTSIHSSTRGNQLSSRGNETTIMTDDPNTQPVADAATPDSATQSQLLQTQEDDNGISIKEEEEKEQDASVSTPSPKSISSPSSRMPPDLVQHSCSTVAECGEDEEQDEEDVAATTVLDEALQTLSSPEQDEDSEVSSDNNGTESSGSSNSKKNIRIIPEQLAAAAEATAKLIGSPLPPAPPLLGSFSNAEHNNNKDKSANEPTAATTKSGVHREDDNVCQPSPTSDATPLVVDDGSVDDDDLAFFMEKKEEGLEEEEEEGEEMNNDGGGGNDDNELQNNNNNNIEEFFDRDDAPDEWEDIDNRLFAELPFELLALDVVLEAVAALLLEDAGKLNQRANKIMKNVYSSKKQPEDRRRRSSNGKRMSNGHETTHGIEQLRVLKDKVKGMDFRIKGFTRAIDQVLNDDEDMALMNLSRLLTHPERFIMPVSPDILNEESDEPELILEAYLQQALTASNSLELLSGQITTTEQLIDMKLDTIRNQLLFVNTAVSLVMLFVSLGSLIGSIFGMNLTTGLETSPTAFKQVVIGTLVSCVILFSIFALWFWKKNTWLLHA